MQQVVLEMRNQGDVSIAYISQCSKEEEIKAQPKSEVIKPKSKRDVTVSVLPSTPLDSNDYVIFDFIAVPEIDRSLFPEQYVRTMFLSAVPNRIYRKTVEFLNPKKSSP